MKWALSDKLVEFNGNAIKYLQFSQYWIKLIWDKSD